jgi:methylmalonyl-CoA mutase cobalamin-binding domain/chain
MAEVHYSITFAAKKSGLTAHVIRVWEKRYKAVSPNRSQSNRRRYSDVEIARLRLLSTATKAGHRIGDIAKLADEKLERLVLESAQEAPAISHRRPLTPDLAESALQAVRDFDAAAMLRILERSSVSFGQHGLLQNMIGPLANRIGILWQEGAMTAAHEHFATATIRGYLLKNSHPFAENSGAPRLIVVTPSGQLHELGAAIVAAAARDVGWAITYLGSNLPASEIASAAVLHNADAVALSIVYPGDDANLPAELRSLRKLLPAEIRIIAGGRAAESYAAALEEIGATRTTDLNALYTFLDRTRPSQRQLAKPASP